MALSHIRHNIQVKEEKKVPFFSLECCEWSGPEADWPIRCSKHNTELKTWQRSNKSKDKWERLFMKNFQRWKFVKMLTITTPPVLHWETFEDNKQNYLTTDMEDLDASWVRKKFEDKTRIITRESYQVKLRDILRSRFKYMRKRSKFWDKYVDGGEWFYECPIDENGIANPHLHVLLVGPKLIPVHEMSEEFSKYGLGEVTYFSSPKNSNGVIQKMTYWRERKLVVNKSAVRRALNYVSAYMKKAEQADGKNNSWFGSLYNK